MPESRYTRLTVNLEPSLAALVRRTALTNDETDSNYIRGALIRDLHARGVITTEMLLRITSLSTREVEKLVVTTT